jgi:AraC-like DNA-binding protein
MKIGDRFNPYRMFVGAFLPNWLLQREEVSMGAKVVYARLAQFAGEKGKAFPKVETIAREVGLSERQVQRYLAELEEHSLIGRRNRAAEMKPSDYFFLAHAWFLNSLEVEDEQDPVTDMSPPPVTDMSPPGRRIRHHLEENQGRESVEKKEEGPPATEASLSGSPPEDEMEGNPGTPVIVCSVEQEVDDRLAQAQDQIEAAKARFRAAREEKLAKTRDKEIKEQNLKGGVVSLSRTKILKRLEARWMQEMADRFPGLKFATWGPKEKKQAYDLVEKYGGEIIEYAVQYLIREWERIQARYLKGKGSVPGLGFLLKFHDSLVPEAQRYGKLLAIREEWQGWFKQHPGDMYPPGDLEKRYQEARRDLEALGLT